MEEALKDQAGRTDESFQNTDGPMGLTAQMGEAADNLVAETAQCVRHYPVSAVAAAFGGGALIGWLIAHTLKRQHYAGRADRQRRAGEDKINQRAISTWEDEGGADRG
jgi:hypothetical protein